MNNKKYYLLKLILLLSDFIILNVSYCSAFFFSVLTFDSYTVQHHLLSLFVFNAVWMVVAAVTRLYSYKVLSSTEKIYRNTWRTILMHGAVFTCIYIMLHLQHSQYFFLVFCYGVGGVLWALSRLLFTYITEFVFKKVVSKRKVLIVGDNHQGRQLADYFNRNKNFYSLAGIYSNTQLVSSEDYCRGTPVDCVDFASRHHVTDIYATTLPDEDKGMQYLKDAAENKGMRVLFVAASHQTIAEPYHRIDSIDAMPVLSLRAEPLLTPNNALRKRLFDIVFSTIVIVLFLSWFTPLMAIIIMLNSKGPVFFKQQRSGKDNNPFWCYKFRSMVVNNACDQLQAVKGDSRITSIGAFIRKTSIDELPQFFNVWIGNMSIVGPRPHMLKHTEEYSAIIDKYLVRQYLKPGITGWAQVNGYRGETTDVRLMEKRVSCDLAYMEEWSLMLDVKIVCMTIINAIRGEENAR